MAGIFKILFTQLFSSTDIVEVTHNADFEFLKIKVVIDDEDRDDLIEKITVDSTDPTNKLTVKLKTPQTGALYLLRSDFVGVGEFSSTEQIEVVSDDQLTTTSGVLQDNIDGKSDIGHTHTEVDITDLDKYTKAEVNTISGSINDDLVAHTSDVSIHREHDDALTTNTNLWSAEKIQSEITTATGTLTTDHGELGGLDDDDHLHYHNDLRGDVRYYTQTALNAGQLDSRYYTEAEIDVHVNSTANPHSVTLEQARTSGNIMTGGIVFNPLVNMTVIDVSGSNLDLVWMLGHSTDGYGYYWKYEGTGSGDANYLYLYSENATGPDFWFYRCHQVLQEMDIGVKLNIQNNLAVQFRDSAISINSASDGHLDLNADTQVDINSSLYVSGSFTIDGGVSVLTIRDEDDFGHDDAAALVTQQSAKAYVDNSIDTVSGSLQSNLDAHTSDVSIHREHDDASMTSTNLWSAEKISQEITTATGSLTTDHSDLLNLDYASSGHSGFMSLDTNQTVSGIKTFNEKIILTNIESDVLPSVDDTYDLGSSTNNWKYLHVETIHGNPNDNLYLSTSNNRQIRLYSDRDIINCLGDHAGTNFWQIEDDMDEVQMRVYSDGQIIFGAENPVGSEQFRFVGDVRIEGDTYIGGTTVTGILDEDDMVSSSAQVLSTQQSIKAYVDNTTSASGHTHDGRYYTEVEVNTISGSLQNGIDDDYHYDSSRSKVLSKTKFFLGWGRNNNNASTEYLRSYNGTPSNRAPDVMFKKGTILSMCMSTRDNETWSARLENNLVAIAGTNLTCTTSNQTYVTNLNIDFDAGARLSCYIYNGSGLSYPKVRIEVAWRE